jgi:hypothetical protein
MKATDAMTVVLDPDSYSKETVSEARDTVKQFRDRWGTTIDVLAEHTPKEVLASFMQYVMDVK